MTMGRHVPDHSQVSVTSTLMLCKPNLTSLPDDIHRGERRWGGDKIMDENRHSSCYHPSIFGKVHLHVRGAMTGSRMLMHLTSRGRKQQLRRHLLHIYKFGLKKSAFNSLAFMKTLDHTTNGINVEVFVQSIKNTTQITK